MPKNTIYVMILREPSTRFESSFIYYKDANRSFKRVRSGNLETFLKEPEEDSSMHERNTQAFDLGLDKDCSGDDEQYVQASLSEVEKVFSLVMITEYFDEGFVVFYYGIIVCSVFFRLTG